MIPEEDKSPEVNDPTEVTDDSEGTSDGPSEISEGSDADGENPSNEDPNNDKTKKDEEPIGEKEEIKQQTNGERIENVFNTAKMELLFQQIQDEEQHLQDITEDFIPAKFDSDFINTVSNDLGEYIKALTECRFLVIECDKHEYLSDIQNALGIHFAPIGYKLLALDLTLYQAAKINIPLNFNYLYELLINKRVRDKVDKKIVFFIEGSYEPNEQQLGNRFLQSLLIQYNTFQRQQTFLKSRDIFIVYLSPSQISKTLYINNANWRYPFWRYSYLENLIEKFCCGRTEEFNYYQQELAYLKKEKKWQDDLQYLHEVELSIQNSSLEKLLEEKRKVESFAAYNNIDEVQSNILSSEDSLLKRYAVFVIVFFPNLTVAYFRELMEVLLKPLHKEWLAIPNGKTTNRKESLLTRWKQADDDILDSIKAIITRDNQGRNKIQFKKPDWKLSYKEYFKDRYANFVQRQLSTLLDYNTVKALAGEEIIKQGIIELSAQLAAYDVVSYGHQVVINWINDASEKLFLTQNKYREIVALEHAKRSYEQRKREANASKPLEELIASISGDLAVLETDYDTKEEFQDLQNALNENLKDKDKLIHLLEDEIGTVTEIIKRQRKIIRDQHYEYTTILNAISMLLLRFVEDEFLKEKVVNKLLGDLQRDHKHKVLLANLIGKLNQDGNYEYFDILISLLKEKKTAETASETIRILLNYSPFRLYDILEKISAFHPKSITEDKSKLSVEEAYSLMLLPSYIYDMEKELDQYTGDWPPKHPLLAPLEVIGEQREELIIMLVNWMFHPSFSRAYEQIKDKMARNRNKEVGLIRLIFIQQCFVVLVGSYKQPISAEGRQLMGEILLKIKQKTDRKQNRELLAAFNQQVVHYKNIIGSIRNNNQQKDKSKIAEKKDKIQEIRDLKTWYKSLK